MRLQEELRTEKELTSSLKTDLEQATSEGADSEDEARVKELEERLKEAEHQLDNSKHVSGPTVLIQNQGRGVLRRGKCHSPPPPFSSFTPCPPIGLSNPPGPFCVEL